MARYQVILAYDGTEYKGYQRQANARSVQGEFESALTRLNWQGRAVLSAGRTDSGVHASGQVVAFDLDWPHSCLELGQALNAYLPGDMAVRGVRVAAMDFHPRYDACARTYHYQVYCQRERHPLWERFAWRVWPEVQLTLLQQAAQLLIGRHDYSAFGTPPHPGNSTVREVFRAEWQEHENGYRFTVTANAFLYHMVRRMVYLQVQVGQGRLALEALAQGVQAAFPLAPGLAPAQGLTLKEVLYSENDDKQLSDERNGEDDSGKDFRPER